MSKSPYDTKKITPNLYGDRSPVDVSLVAGHIDAPELRTAGADPERVALSGVVLFAVSGGANAGCKKSA